VKDDVASVASGELAPRQIRQPDDAMDSEKTQNEQPMSSA
jgi:hypothetical protein